MYHVGQKLSLKPTPGTSGLRRATVLRIYPLFVLCEIQGKIGTYRECINECTEPERIGKGRSAHSHDNKTQELLTLVRGVSCGI